MADYVACIIYDMMVGSYRPTTIIIEVQCFTIDRRGVVSHDGAQHRSEIFSYLMSPAQLPALGTNPHNKLGERVLPDLLINTWWVIQCE